MKTKIYIEFILLILLGALTSLSLPPFNYFIINFFTFSFLFVFLVKKFSQHKNYKLYFFYGWLFGFGYFITNLYWISISLTFDKNFQFLIPFTIFLIPAFIASFYGLTSLFFFVFKTKKTISSFFVFSIVFGILEYIRGFILTGFPWNLIAYSFSDHYSIISVISLFGTYGFNLFCISLFISPALVFLNKSKKTFVFFISFLTIFIFFHFYGINYKNEFYKLENKTYDYKIRVIGSNINLDRFYEQVDPELVISDLINLSNPEKNKKTIFIWPEGILPGVPQNKLIDYDWLFQENFSKNHFLIIGINSQIKKNGSDSFFNSLSLYDHELNLVDSYNKINLVPFGEFLPFESILKKIGLRSITNNYQSFSRGKKRNIIDISKEEFSLKILPLICYEIIYSGKLFDNSNFDLIINISEDGWFGQSVGPTQHFVHSIFRAIESGKYILRSANNGVAAAINPLGEIEKKVDFNKSGYIDFYEYKKIQPTVFSIYKNKIFVLLILLYIFLAFSFNRIKNE